LEQNIINDREDILYLLNLVNREFGTNYLLVPILEDYIAFISKDKNTLKIKHSIIRDIIKIEKKENPFLTGLILNEGKTMETVTVNKKALEWLVSDDTGMSSLTLCSALYGVPRKNAAIYYPRDPSDFGRCKRFLAVLCPQDKERALSLVKEISPEWKALVKEWESLENAGKDDICAKMTAVIDKAVSKKYRTTASELI